MEENVEFREAVLAAGFNSNSYEGIAEAIGCSVPYVRQIHQGSKPFSTAMRNKLTELAYGDNGQVDDGSESIPTDMDAIVEMTKTFNKTKPQEFVSGNYEVTRSAEGTWLVCQMRWTTIASATTEENAQKVCDALNKS